MICYKFRAFDQRALEILINRELYFAAPHTLNDPLDNQLDIEKEYELAQVPLIYIEDAEERFQKFFLLNLLNSKRFDDKKGGKITFNQAIQRFVSSMGILSLSKTVTDALLWSHYAAGHTGIAVGIETDLLPASEIHDQGNIAYTDNPPYAAVFRELLEDIGKFVKPWEEARKAYPDDVADKFYTKQIGQMVRANRYTKSERWSYEEEYRIVRLKPGFVEFPSFAIKEIVFGQRTDEKDIRTVMNLLRGDEWNHVQVSRAQPVPGTFRLSLIPIRAGTTVTTTELPHNGDERAANVNVTAPSHDT
ncbi:DUF2971 domain-containing protein [Burkholderia ubonensis]|uniref:DUF2971 domain-containing protein n=1 Tax=Burkholderia ubonensis TaxID=101571 RepID=UPI0009B33592|nr:DUF2971 domain-containing protein [Burkholderia ubonensis]